MNFTEIQREGRLRHLMEQLNNELNLLFIICSVKHSAGKRREKDSVFLAFFNLDLLVIDFPNCDLIYDIILGQRPLL